MKKRMTIRNWRDMEQFGVSCLTGEACAISLRILVDLNKQGVELITQFLGGTIEIREGTNWNSSVNGEDAIASVLLSKYILDDLAVFALANDGHDTIYVLKDSVTGTGDYGTIDLYEEICVRRYLGVAGNNRNKHQMSGRTI